MLDETKKQRDEDPFLVQLDGVEKKTDWNSFAAGIALGYLIGCAMTVFAFLMMRH